MHYACLNLDFTDFKKLDKVTALIDLLFLHLCPACFNTYQWTKFHHQQIRCHFGALGQTLQQNRMLEATGEQKEGKREIIVLTQHPRCQRLYIYHEYSLPTNQS